MSWRLWMMSKLWRFDHRHAGLLQHPEDALVKCAHTAKCKSNDAKNCLPIVGIGARAIHNVEHFEGRNYVLHVGMLVAGAHYGYQFNVLAAATNHDIREQLDYAP